MRTADELRAALIELQGKDNYLAKEIGPAPWAVELRGRRWLAATNGHAMVAVAGDAGDAPMPSSKRVASISKWFDGDDGDVIDLSALAAFVNAGAASRHCEECHDKRTVECDDCDGQGETDCTCSCGHDHEAECDTCGGDGYVACKACASLTEKRPARLRSHVVNRQVVREVIETIGVMEGTARLSCNGQRVYRLVPDEPEPAWMAVFMPLRDVDPNGVDFDKPETW